MADEQNTAQSAGVDFNQLLSSSMSSGGVSEEAQQNSRAANRRGRDKAAELEDAVVGENGTVAQTAQKVRQDTAGPLAQAGRTMDDAELGMAAADEDAGKAQETYKKALEANLGNRVRVTEQMNVMDALSKQIASANVRDPWADASTGVKIGALLSVGLGAAAQALDGSKVNAAAEIIQQHIQRDIMLQRMRLEKNKDDYSMKNTLLGRLVAHSDHIEDAAQKAYITAMEGVKGRITAMQALTTNAMHRASLANIAAGLDMGLGSAATQALENTMGKSILHSEHEANTELQAGKSTGSIGGVARLLGAKNASDKLEQHQGERAEERALPGYHPADGAGYKGNQKAIETFRTAAQNHETADRNLGTLFQAVDNLKGKSLASVAPYREFKQALAQVTIKMKNGDNMGANFSDMEKELETRGILGGSEKTGWVILDPEGYKKAIARKAAEYRKELADQGKYIGAERDR